MNLDQYVQDAVRTESKIDEVTLVDAELFESVLRIFIASGTILDYYKKNVFYGKPINWDSVDSKLELIEYLSLIGPMTAAFDVHDNLPSKIDINPRIFHSLIGTATEATELMEALHATMEGEEIDYVNVMEEFGDINWYESIGCDATNVSFEKILTTNIEKLRKRFPEKFTSENAINRDLNEERNTLKKGLE